MYYGKFSETSPDSVKPAGFLAGWLEKQNRALSSCYREQGFPFDTPMWNGGVGKIIPASIVYNDEAAETPSQEAWWPYEQTAYLLDGLVRLGIIAGDREKISLFEENLKFVTANPDENGLLGHAYGASDSEWPMAVFFRAAAAYCEYSGDQSAKEAFINHYRNLTTEKLAKGFRHINNIEGVLKTYGWSGDESLLKKAVDAYRVHDEYYKLHTEDEFELYWSKLTSGLNFVIHGVSFSESLKLPVLLYLYSGKEEFLQGAEEALARVLAAHCQIPGLPSSNEDLAGRDPLQGYETCVINDFAWSLGYFLMATGNGSYADRMEKIFYNAFPGSLLKDFSALQYLSSPNQVIATAGSNHSFFYRGCATFRQFRADHSAQCCTGNVHRIMPDFIMRMWMLDQEGAPAAVLYGPSVYSGSFNGRKYTITSATEYPVSENIVFKFECQDEICMPFSFRIPGWCKAPAVKINGTVTGIPETCRGFAKISRVWRSGDTLELILPMEAVRVTDRYWAHYEYGPLVFALPVESSVTREYDSPFAPCAVEPLSPWNYGVSADARVEVIRNAGGSLFSMEPPLKMVVEAQKVTNFDALELGRYTPEVPLFHEPYGAKEKITLVPYASTLLRITAFPDNVRRKALNCHQVLASPVYPYNFTVPVSEQKFLPELIPAEQCLAMCSEVVPERSGYCDLFKAFPQAENSAAYLFFRFYSECDREAYFALSVSSGGEFFFGGKKICVIEPVSDAEYIAPEIVKADLKRGYNILVAKCVIGQIPMQYRRVWGARVQAFYI